VRPGGTASGTPSPPDPRVISSPAPWSPPPIPPSSARAAGAQPRAPRPSATVLRSLRSARFSTFSDSFAGSLRFGSTAALNAAPGWLGRPRSGTDTTAAEGPTRCQRGHSHISPPRHRSWSDIGHLQPETAVTLRRNGRSRSTGISGQITPRRWGRPPRFSVQFLPGKRWGRSWNELGASLTDLVRCWRELSALFRQKLAKSSRKERSSNAPATVPDTPHGVKKLSDQGKICEVGLHACAVGPLRCCLIRGAQRARSCSARL
jgi:hypothetical protein